MDPIGLKEEMDGGVVDDEGASKQIDIQCSFQHEMKAFFFKPNQPDVPGGNGNDPTSL